MVEDLEQMVQFMFAQACKNLAIVKEMAAKHGDYTELDAIHWKAKEVTQLTPQKLLETAAEIEAGIFL